MSTLFEKGKSGNPSGRSKQHAEVSALAKAEAPVAFKRIIDIATQPAIDLKTRFQANQYIVDRAIGKPTQATTISNAAGEPFIVQIIPHPVPKSEE
jgi:hypothetical protein